MNEFASRYREWLSRHFPAFANASFGSSSVYRLLSILFVCLMLPGVAQAALPDCSGLLAGHAQPLSLRAGTIVGTGKAFFLSEIGADCTAPGHVCRVDRSPYVLPGDRLAITATAPGYVCVSYPPARGDDDVHGWLPARRVRVESPASSSDDPSAFLGAWRTGDMQTITIRRASSGGLDVEGNAIWQGITTPNVGEISGPLTIAGATARYADGHAVWSCAVVMRRIGDRLAVLDNGQCGGVNVTFGGWYRKQQR